MKREDKKWLSRCCRQKTVSVWPQPHGKEGRVGQLGTAVQDTKQLPWQCQNNGKEAHKGRAGETAKEADYTRQQEKNEDAVEEKLLWRLSSLDEASNLLQWSRME